ncbi:MAG TPA: response regulator, partial [Myxococcaceae bacterium]|nr:response regulator [Myxococcaceae bacterium]
MSANILLVDDSPTVRNILKIYLMNLKMGFVEAEDATRALQLLRLVPVKLVIADINMPGM